MHTKVTHRHALYSDKIQKHSHYWPVVNIYLYTFSSVLVFSYFWAHFTVLIFGLDGEGRGLGEGRNLQYIHPQHLYTEGGLNMKWETFLPWCAEVLKETEWGEKHLVSRRCSSVCRWAACAYFFSVRDQLKFTFYCFGLHAVGPLNPLRFLRHRICNGYSCWLVNKV